MQDWKTTVSGIVIGVATLLKVFGVEVPQAALDGVIAVGVLALAWFAKDK